MRRQYSGRILKAIDQQSADVVRGIVDRAHNFLASFLSHPTGSRFEEAGGNILIVDAIEEAKATDIGMMFRIIIWVVTGHDPAHDFAVSFRQKQCGVSVQVKGMPFSIEECLALEDQWWHPGGIIPVDAPGKANESIAVRA